MTILRRVGLLTAVGLWGLVAGPASSQPLLVRVGDCSLEAPADAERALHSLGARAPAILTQLEADLGTRPAAAYHIVLIPPGPWRDPALARLDAAAPPWAAGFLLPEWRVGGIRVAEAGRYPYGTLESVLAHEAAHMLLHDACAGRLPRWFEEGVATREGRRWSLEDVLIYSSSLLTTDLPSLAALDQGFRSSEGEARLAYAASFAFVAWNIRRQGPSFVRDMVREAGRQPFPQAWQVVTGAPLARAEAAWRRESLLRYRWLAVLTASSTLWVAITLLAFVAGLARQLKARRVRARWAAEEAAAPPDEPEDAG